MINHIRIFRFNIPTAPDSIQVFGYLDGPLDYCSGTSLQISPCSYYLVVPDNAQSYHVVMQIVNMLSTLTLKSISIFFKFKVFEKKMWAVPICLSEVGLFNHWISGFEMKIKKKSWHNLH